MPEKEKAILVWYKRDLRVSDHRPLSEAFAAAKLIGARVLAFYCFEPSVVSAPDFSGFHRQFIEDSLLDLSDSLARIGVPLLVFERNVSDAMKFILSSYDVPEVFSHEETGNAITFRRDVLMGKFLRSKGIRWTEFPTNGVVRRLRSRDGWSKIWNARMSEPTLPVPDPQDSFVPILESDSWRSTAVRFAIQKWGETEGFRTLRSFLRNRGRSYVGGMTRPIEWMDASSRVSPYLAYGCLSLKQAVQATHSRLGELAEKGDARFARALRSFLSRLHWQSHFIQKLESEPRFEYENALPEYDAIRTEYDERIISAVENAQTGIPFIDGTVRQLRATGWINFRARATLVSFVCSTCMQPWQGRFAHWLARLFTDYEPGIHYPQLQMQAGTMGINTIRVYNPVKQMLDKDPDGKFVETWLPELARLPDRLRAEPWKTSPMESVEYDFVPGRDYPLPVIDVARANAAARKTLYALRDSVDPEAKQALAKKHASRKKAVRKSRSPVKQSKPQAENLTLFE